MAQACFNFFRHVPPRSARRPPVLDSGLPSVPVAQRTTSAARSEPVEPASLGRRFGAVLVDWILCVMVASIFADPRRTAWPAPVVLIVEYAFFLGLFAQTPGMRLAKIRCVSVEDGGRIG